MATKKYVVNLFNNIAPTYDKLNHILSLNIDKSWRRKAVQQVQKRTPQRVLDVACGTGDFALALVAAGVPQVVGADVSNGMLEVARTKIDAAGYNDRLTVEVQDCEKMSYAPDSFDAITVAFGIRNFEHLMQGLREMHRVLRPNGQVVILELSVPDNTLLYQLYKLYFMHILPLVGGWISGNKEAYTYLPQSVLRFPRPIVVEGMLRDCGFAEVRHRALTCGLCRMYIGIKKVDEVRRT
jgi:demethylmenaquinone methyltransferase/2-methoxy-6-polyprenyl-1,4-benzoquinol methylase